MTDAPARVTAQVARFRDAAEPIPLSPSRTSATTCSTSRRSPARGVSTWAGALLTTRAMDHTSFLRLKLFSVDGRRPAVTAGRPAITPAFFALARAAVLVVPGSFVVRAI